MVDLKAESIPCSKQRPEESLESQPTKRVGKRQPVEARGTYLVVNLGLKLDSGLDDIHGGEGT
jgi:hypothetical protein